MGMLLGRLQPDSQRINLGSLRMGLIGELVGLSRLRVELAGEGMKPGSYGLK